MRLAVAILVALAFSSLASANANRDPKTLVLRLADMPTGFKVKAAGYQSNSEVADKTTPVQKFREWGRLSGYHLETKRDATLETLFTGPLAITSSVSVYRSEDGAHDATMSGWKHCGKRLSLGRRIGDEARLCSITKRSGPYTAQVFIVLWRDGPVVAVLADAGLKGGPTPEGAVRLAIKQEQRIA